MVCGTHSYALAAIAVGYIANMTGANKRYASDSDTSADFQRADYGIAYQGQDTLSAAADLLGSQMSIPEFSSQKEDSKSYFGNTSSNTASVPVQSQGTMGSYSGPEIRLARRKQQRQERYVPLLDPPVAVYFLDDKTEFIPAWLNHDVAGGDAGSTEYDFGYAPNPEMRVEKEKSPVLVKTRPIKQPSSEKQNLVRLIRQELAEPEQISKNDLAQKIRQELSEKQHEHRHPALVLYNEAA